MCFLFYHIRYKQKFSQFVHETLKHASQPITLPDDGSAYDVYFDVRHGTFNKWADKQLEKCRNFASHYTVTPEVCHFCTVDGSVVKPTFPVLSLLTTGSGLPIWFMLTGHYNSDKLISKGKKCAKKTITLLVFILFK